jgi:CheY-like chemotaxis protein
MAHILVVEDEAIVALDIQSRLRHLGYAVPVLASTGREAIRLAGEAHPDLILMDIRLRGDGRCVRRAILP